MISTFCCIYLLQLSKVLTYTGKNLQFPCWVLAWELLNSHANRNSHANPKLIPNNGLAKQIPLLGICVYHLMNLDTHYVFLN